MATTYHNLVTNFRADTTDLEKGSARATASIGKFGSQARNGSLILQNFGEGIIDAQYGLRNITNNLDVVAARWQIMVEKSGSAKKAFSELGKSLTSPVGIITGVTLLINFAPQIIGYFNTWIGASTKAKEALDEFRKSIGETDKTQNEVLLEKTTAALQEQLESLAAAEEKLATIGVYDRYGNFTTAYLDVKRLKEEVEKLYQAQADAAQAVNDENFIEKSTDLYKKQNEEISHNLALLAAKGASAKDLLIAELEYKKAIDPTTVATNIYTEILKDIEILEAKLKNLPTVTEEVTGEIDAALASGLASTFTNISRALGESLAGEEDFGAAFLKTLGSFMQALGSAIITIGVGMLALEHSFTNPWAAIAAGAALVAGGALLSAAAKKNPAAGGSAASASAASAISANTAQLVAVQGSQQTVRVVGEIRGQDLRLIQQRASDSYSGLS